MIVILDSNFVIYAMRKRIDFLSQLENQGFSVRFARESIQELKDFVLKQSSSQEDKAIIDAALKMLERNNVKYMSVGGQKIHDWLLENGKKGYYIATTDSELKRKVPRTIELFEEDGTVRPIEKP